MNKEQMEDMKDLAIVHFEEALHLAIMRAACMLALKFEEKCLEVLRKIGAEAKQ